MSFIPLRLPYLIAQLADELLERSSSSFGRKPTMDLGTFVPKSALTRPGFYASQSPRRLDWHRTQVPLIGYPRIPAHLKTVHVPAAMLWKFRNEKDLPQHLPLVRIRPGLSRAAQQGLGSSVRGHSMQIARQHPQRPEQSRRRKDQKVPRGYRRLLSLVNRTYGPYSEYMETVHAFQQSAGDPSRFVELMAINQAIDVVYGKRAKLLKEHVYSHKLWVFPVGYDTLSRLWR